MRALLSSRALLRGLLAGAVVLTSAACSRSDRAENGRDNSAAVLPDTTNGAQPSGGGTVTGAVNDTVSGTLSDTATGTDRPSSSAQPSPAAPSNTPRAETASPSDKDAAGYRPMERDTAAVPDQHPDSARVTADTADVSSVSSDTTSISSASTVSDSSSTASDTVSADASVDSAGAGYAEMARDTSSVADQADSAATPTSDVALQATVDTSSQADAEASAETGVTADTTVSADRIRPTEDSTEVVGQVTTDSTTQASPSPDSTEVVRVRPPEDSTETLGNVTSTDQTADETADERVVAPDSGAVATSEPQTDEAGAAALGGDVTGAEAVGLMTRQGVRCGVTDPESTETVRWDMSNTPAALNPCGMGSMVLSRIWTEGSVGRE